MFIVVLVALAWTSDYRVKGNKLAMSRLFTDADAIPSDTLLKFDAVLVLGGGVPNSIDHPPVYVERRADDAASVARRFETFSKGKRKVSEQENDEHRSLVSNKSSPLPIICLSAGTAHLPQLLSSDGLPIWESTSCAAYLREKHGLEKDVFVETTSYDTIGNAFYTRTTHTDISGWRNLLVITNAFHMDRTMAIFDWIFLQCNDDNYQLHYLSSPDVGLTEEAVEARREREKKSEKTVREILAPKHTTLKDVWKFLTHEHSLYSASGLVKRGKGDVNSVSSSMIKQSYGAADGKRK